MRTRHLAMVALLLTGSGGAFSADERSPTGGARVLPEVKVSGDVPLVKIGELKMRERRLAPAAAVHGDFIYIVAGSGADTGPLDSIERLNVRTGDSEPFAK